MFDHIKPIDPRAERRRRLLIAALAFLILAGAYLYYEFKNFREEAQAKRFFTALQQHNYEEAYKDIWQPTSSYAFKDFLEDWGENGIAGPVQEFHVTGSNERGTGVIVRVRINGNQDFSLWVEKKDKSLSFPP